MAALSDPKLPEVVELSHLDVSEFDALFGEEIAVWNHRFQWDFRPSADLLRRFLLVRSLIGYALRVGADKSRRDLDDRSSATRVGRAGAHAYIEREAD